MYLPLICDHCGTGYTKKVGPFDAIPPWAESKEESVNKLCMFPHFCGYCELVIREMEMQDGRGSADRLYWKTVWDKRAKGKHANAD